MKPRYLDAGISESRPLFIKQVNTPYLDKPFHFHPNCELVYIEKGYGKRIIGDNVANFQDGDLVLMGPDLPHIWMNDALFYKGDKNLKSISTVIYFSPKLLDNLLDQSGKKAFHLLIEKSRRGIAIRGRTKELIREKLQELIYQNGLSQIISFLSILESIMETKELQYLSGDKFMHMYKEKDTHRINSIYYYLMQNLSHDILLEEVASIVNMAPTAFCRYFKSNTGKTFSKVLNELRIQHACSLLLNPDKSISEICYESGYNNLANFNKFFKEIVKQTPTNYRASINQ